jgi:hypothetical protein
MNRRMRGPLVRWCERLSDRLLAYRLPTRLCTVFYLFLFTMSITTLLSAYTCQSFTLSPTTITFQDAGTRQWLFLSELLLFVL